MVPKRVPALLLAVLGLALMFNSVWLLPQEGDTQYTVDRTEITVENGTFDYRNDADGPGHEFNDLVPVACDGRTGDRLCAFDQHLVTDGPVTVAGDPLYGSDQEFVQLDGGYYRRTVEDTENGTVYDVERVAPRALLDEVAVNVSSVSPADARDRALPVRVAVTGDTGTTTEFPDGDRIGQVYLRNGTFYTVVVVDEGAVDTPLFEEWMHDALGIAGLLLVVVGVVVAVGDRRPEL
ncbi:hypothetical protein BV210_05655 [Halorientalis sp. IM1011]|uniref:hypothetical protein n=1 Tax=Halorientalis sp. IM1011 TaxID=1932360 RepID=UPI00097CC790|nr:hypothetical protein [Halorientalis sp. IM1011]AQL42229.1 hypothetical protein BV210_05655 [Halorientalis sp. IM1011]